MNNDNDEAEPETKPRCEHKRMSLTAYMFDGDKVTGAIYMCINCHTNLQVMT